MNGVVTLYYKRKMDVGEIKTDARHVIAFQVRYISSFIYFVGRGRNGICIFMHYHTFSWKNCLVNA